MRTMGFKPFFHRLNLRTRIWNVRLQQREQRRTLRFNLLKQKRYRRKPWAAKRALSRAWCLTNWGKLFDPEIPF